MYVCTFSDNEIITSIHQFKDPNFKTISELNNSRYNIDDYEKNGTFTLEFIPRLYVNQNLATVTLKFIS